jgi:hypothetical protein
MKHNINKLERVQTAKEDMKAVLLELWKEAKLGD